MSGSLWVIIVADFSYFILPLFWHPVDTPQKQRMHAFWKVRAALVGTFPTPTATLISLISIYSQEFQSKLTFPECYGHAS